MLLTGYENDLLDQIWDRMGYLSCNNCASNTVHVFVQLLVSAAATWFCAIGAKGLEANYDGTRPGV